jgi:hypothetical protein
MWRKSYTCADLSKGEGKCSLSDCVQKVQGLVSDSSSSSDTWILIFKPGTMNKGEHVSTGFMKLWLTADEQSLQKMKMYEGHINNKKWYSDSLENMRYETIVYRDIIRPLIDARVAPVFVSYITSSSGCDLKEMSKFLKGLDNPKQRILNNLVKTMYPDDARPKGPIDGDNITSKYSESQFKGLKFSYLVTEAVEKAVTLTDWVTEVLSSGEHSYEQFWNVLFQILVGCYAMGLSRMTHNDLHSGNVFVQDLGEEKPMLFVVEGKCYHFNTRYRPLIYDFDRSYVESLGKNKLDDSSNDWKVNRVSTKKDIFQVLCMVRKNELIPVEVASEISSILSSNPETATDMLDATDLYGSKCFMRRIRNRFGWHEFVDLNEPLDMINSVGKLAMINEGPLAEGKPIPSNDVYVCNSQMFDDYGRIYPEYLNSDRYSITASLPCFEGLGDLAVYGEEKRQV